jgi:protein-L-isoaspartate(D-aspartate) O-methyltransferase
MTSSEEYRSPRQQMIEYQLRRRGISDEAVLAAMEAVPRERFVPEEFRPEAYADNPLPIGHDQTISQPYVVALMLQHLRCTGEDRVLDIGSGSGYQTALLARLAGEVFAVERHDELTRRAEQTLREMGIENVTFATRDGSAGWAEHAPFDRIICGAAGPRIPQVWIDQLADGGRIVAPVGGAFTQDVEVLEKTGETIRREKVCGVRFVRLIGKHGYSM